MYLFEWCSNPFLLPANVLYILTRNENHDGRMTVTSMAVRALFVFDNYRLPVKTGMSCGCEKQIIQRNCLLCESFSPLQCIPHNKYLLCQSTRKIFCLGDLVVFNGIFDDDDGKNKIHRGNKKENLSFRN